MVIGVMLAGLVLSASLGFGPFPGLHAGTDHTSTIADAPRSVDTLVATPRARDRHAVRPASRAAPAKAASQRAKRAAVATPHRRPAHRTPSPATALPATPVAPRPPAEPSALAPAVAAGTGASATAAVGTGAGIDTEQVSPPDGKRNQRLSLVGITSTMLQSGVRQLHLRFSVRDGTDATAAPAPEIAGYTGPQDASADTPPSPTQPSSATTNTAAGRPGADGSAQTAADGVAPATGSSPAEPGTNYIDVTLTMPDGQPDRGLNALRLVVDLFDASGGAEGPGSEPSSSVSLRVRMSASADTNAAPSSAEAPPNSDGTSNAVQIIAPLPDDSPAAQPSSTPVAQPDGVDDHGRDGSGGRCHRGPRAPGDISGAPDRDVTDAPGNDGAASAPVDAQPAPTPDPVLVVMTVSTDAGVTQGDQQTVALAMADTTAGAAGDANPTATVIADVSIPDVQPTPATPAAGIDPVATAGDAGQPTSDTPAAG